MRVLMTATLAVSLVGCASSGSGTSEPSATPRELVASTSSAPASTTVADESDPAERWTLGEETYGRKKASLQINPSDNLWVWCDPPRTPDMGPNVSDREYVIWYSAVYGYPTPHLVATLHFDGGDGIEVDAMTGRQGVILNERTASREEIISAIRRMRDASSLLMEVFPNYPIPEIDIRGGREALDEVLAVCLMEG